MLTEQQETKLLKLLEAYENGKKVSDLPEVEGEGVSSGLLVEVLQDGESRKFDLGKVSPEKKTLQIEQIGLRDIDSNVRTAFNSIVVGEIAAGGYKSGDEIAIVSTTAEYDEEGNPIPVTKELSRETILSSSLQSDGTGAVITATPGGIASYLFNGVPENTGGSVIAMRYESCASAFTIVQVGRRVGIVDRKGYPVYTDEADPMGIPALDADGNPIDGNPVLDEEGNPVMNEDGTPLLETCKQKTVQVDFYISAEEYDNLKISVGQRVTMRGADGRECPGMYFVTSRAGADFSIDHTLGSGIHKFTVGTQINTQEYGAIYPLYPDGMRDTLHLVYDRGLKDEYPLPFGDLQSGTYNIAFPEGSAFWELPTRGWVRVDSSNVGYIEAYAESIDETPIFLALGIIKEADGFWYLETPVDTCVYSRAPANPVLKDMSIDVADMAITSYAVGQSPWDYGVASMLRGLPRAEGGLLELFVTRNPLPRYAIQVMDDDGNLFATDYLMEIIRGGAVTWDKLQEAGLSEVEPLYVAEMWVFSRNFIDNRHFVRIVFNVNGDVLEEYSTIPESLD